MQQLRNNIYFLREYHPFSDNKQDDFDRKIMNIKNYDTEDWKVKTQRQAEDYFYHELVNHLKNCTPDLVLCYIPRSKVGATSHMQNITKRLCAQFNYIDGTDCLFRFKNISSAHNTGYRQPGRHLNSIILHNPEIIKGAKIVLLDDVITTGDSMDECMQILNQAHPQKIIGIGMGYTTH